MQDTTQNKSTFKFGLILMILLTTFFVSACTSNKSSAVQDESQPHTDEKHADGEEHHEGDEH